ncbi:MAG: hypothetical protein KJ901_11200 [Gammaproteobacteria bacterium]|nr:hypothetical protein [Gammaproteobacteria bacterium]MBU1442035.1 hypothetical protein [Gammaproteobacteria bacterium]
MELTAMTDIEALKGDFVFLHFSGYGFQKRGIPLWLVDRVRTLRGRFKAVGIVFHELFASGPPWGSAFWLSGLQQKIARDLLSLADFWLTSREDSAKWLLEHSKSVPHRVLPVFSNVGEPANFSMERRRQLIVFGSSGIRAQVYEWADGEIFRCAQRCDLEIHDIGPTMPEGTVAQALARHGVVAHGKLPAEDVSRTMSGAMYGALAYPANYAAKSSVFAAYSAHALCPVLLSDDYGVHDGLAANVHYADGFHMVGQASVDPISIGRKARLWYEPHCIDAHVAALKAMTAEVR